jgi:hypothetical protein
MFIAQLQDVINTSWDIVHKNKSTYTKPQGND